MRLYRLLESEVNTRRAAALALVGWYLMVPPLSHDGGVDDEAPLSKWFVLDRFDSAAKCKRASGTTYSYKTTKQRLPHISNAQAALLRCHQIYKSRRRRGLFGKASEVSPEIETRWRMTQSAANRSPRKIPC